MQENKNNENILKRTKARNLFLARDYTNAEKLLKEILSDAENVSDDEFLQSQKLLAAIYLRTKNYNKSLEIWQEIEKRFPDNIEALNNLGIVYRSLKNYDKSIEVLKRAESLAGETEDILFNLGSTYKDTKQYEKAIDYFKKLVKLKPDDALAYNYLGTVYLESGDESKAMSSYKKGLLVDPNHPYLNYNLATMYKKDKAFTEALVFYNIALRVNPNWSDVLHGIAEIYTEEGNVQEAINYEKAIIKTEGETEKSCVTLGNAYLKLKDEKKAEQYFQKALKINPASELAVIGYAKYLIEKKQISAALKILANARKAGNDSEEMLVLYANTCLEIKDFANAKELIQEAYKKHKDSIEVLKIYGKLFSLLGQHSNAEKIFLEILNKFPSEIALRLELAEQYYKTGEYQNAKLQLQKYLIEKPSDIDARILLGKCYEKTGEAEKAQTEYKTILNEDPKNLAAMSALSEFLQAHGNVLDAVTMADSMINLQSKRGSEDDLKSLAETLKLYEKATERYNAQKAQRPAFLKARSKKANVQAAEVKKLKEEEESFYLPDENAKAINDLNVPFDDLVELSEEDESWKKDEAIEEISLKDIVDVDSPIDVQSLDEDVSPNLVASPKDISFSSPQNQISDPKPYIPSVSKPFEEQDFVLPNAESEEPLLAEKDAPFDTNAFDHKPAIISKEDEPAFDQDTFDDSFQLKDTNKDEQRKSVDDIQDQMLENYNKGFEAQQDLIKNLSKELENLKASPENKNQTSNKNAEDLLEKQNELIDKLNDKINGLSIPESFATSDNAYDKLARQNDLIDSLNDKLESLNLPEYSSKDQEEEEFFKKEDAHTPAVENSMDKSEDEYISGLKDKIEKSTENLENITEQLENYDELLSLGKNKAEEIKSPQTLEQALFNEGIKLDDLNKRLGDISDRIKKVPVGKIKQDSNFDKALVSISSAEMLSLFRVLRDMMNVLPEKESKKFFVSNERVQMQYIIDKLTGSVGLRMRAIFMKMRNFLEYSNNSFDNSSVTIKSLLDYLKAMAEHLPDTGFSNACVKELDNIIKKMK